MDWLEQQDDTLLRNWLRRTKTPMIAIMPGGEILWCNSSFEDLLGYTNVELIGKMTWRDITKGGTDLAADIALSTDIETGIRTEYQLNKFYTAKNGQAIRVVIDVLRYPRDGEFKCCLVSVIPTDKGVEFALGQLSEIHALMLEMLGTQAKGDRIDAFFRFVNEKPYVGYPIILFFAVLLFGSRVVELVRDVLPDGLPAP